MFFANTTVLLFSQRPPQVNSGEETVFAVVANLSAGWPCLASGVYGWVGGASSFEALEEVVDSRLPATGFSCNGAMKSGCECKREACFVNSQLFGLIFVIGLRGISGSQFSK